MSRKALIEGYLRNLGSQLPATVEYTFESHFEVCFRKWAVSPKGGLKPVFDKPPRMMSKMFDICSVRLKLVIALS